ncbi:MAG: (Fe-S)-binding protein [Pseudomonadota bacterium]|nr:(Fe-S)-binding protein [Pseudomonadota bacterium]
MNTEAPAQPGTRVGLFVTCLVDLFRPSVGFASLKLLEAAGYQVVVPAAQTCCGQPAFNAGDRTGARAIARQLIASFEGYDSIVLPSGSCASMWKQFPDLFSQDPDWRRRAGECAAKTHELSQFLHEVAGHRAAPTRSCVEGPVTYHDGCAGYRELGIDVQPRELLAAAGVEVLENTAKEQCCGFGGTFCNRFDQISNRMLVRKVDALRQTGASVVVAGEMGCLLHVAGKFSRMGVEVACRHYAELLVEGDGAHRAPAVGHAKGQT